jgi:predicted RNA-binding Zn-ribbon protein involved in translation (DUF1610 family)
MATYKISCPECGRSIVLEEEVQETFCPYCGAKFSVSRSRSSGNSDSVILYEATQVVNDILRRVSTYQNDCMELYKKAHKNVSNPFKKLLAGSDEFSISEIHSNYFTVLDKLIKELDGHLSSLSGSGVKSELAKKAIDAILSLPEEKLPFAVALNYSADDVLTEPLLKHLSPEDLKEVYDYFTVPERKKQFYPNQKKLAEKMESMLGLDSEKGLAAVFKKLFR